MVVCLVVCGCGLESCVSCELVVLRCAWCCVGLCLIVKCFWLGCVYSAMFLAGTASGIEENSKQIAI